MKALNDAYDCGKSNTAGRSLAFRRGATMHRSRLLAGRLVPTFGFSRQGRIQEPGGHSVRGGVKLVAYRAVRLCAYLANGRGARVVVRVSRSSRLRLQGRFELVAIATRIASMITCKCDALLCMPLMQGSEQFARAVAEWGPPRMCWSRCWLLLCAVMSLHRFRAELLDFH